MNDRFVRSSINATLLIGALVTLYFLMQDLRDGLSVAGGVLFSIANLYFLWKLIEEIITNEEKKSSNIAGLVTLKFLILWGLFIAVMAFGWASPLHLGIGFTVLLFVFSMKGFGQWMIDYFGSSDNNKKQED